MNIEDLKQLKIKLESMDESIYVPFCLGTGDSSLSIGACPNLQYRTIADYDSNDETLEYTKKVEDLIEKSLRQVESNFIPFDSLTITSQNIVLIDLPFAKKYYDCVDEISKIKWSEELDKHVNKKYVPLNFTLNVGDTGMLNEYGYVTCVEDLTERNIKDIFSEDVITEGLFGVVDIDKFVKIMKDLGYNVTYSYFDGNGNYLTCNYSSESFDQCRLLTDDDEYTASLNVTADFGRIEKLQSSSRT